MSPETVARAREGDRDALDAVVRGLLDGVYRLALRMTAHPADAEDAAQEVMIKVVTRLSTFRGEAAVATWAYRIAVRHLLDRRKSRVEAFDLTFDRFAADLLDGLADPDPALDPRLEREVKLGCTLAMLTCLDRDHRLAYVLADVFDLPGDVAGDVAGVTAEVHRQRLSRARRQLEAFTSAWCGVVSDEAPCRCDRRVARALALGRVRADALSVGDVEPERAVAEMESLHATAALFRGEATAPPALADRIRRLVATEAPSILGP